MKNRGNNKNRKILFALYLVVCLAIITSAYFHLSRIARDYNTRNLELITGLYAEKMNETMEYLQNYAQENVKVIQAMEDRELEEIQQCLESNLDQTIFSSIGFILNDGEVYGRESTVADIQKKQLDKHALESAVPFNSDPYQSSETGTMVMTVFVPVSGAGRIHTLYMSVMIEDLRRVGVYDLLQGKISVYLLKSDSENFVTCIDDGSELSGSWNNLLLQQKYFRYREDYSYSQWIKDMRSGKKEGRFSAVIRGEESTISYRHINGMPGWYVVVMLANRNISDITQHFSAWGGVYGSILVGLTILYMLTIVLMERKDKKRYMSLSTIDPLTGLLNRGAFQMAVETEIASHTPGFFVFIDVDNFKIYNDSYGHDNGDLCLKYVAESMKQCFPKESITGRYGGDEFVAYFKHTQAEEVVSCMKQFQKKISWLTLSAGEQVPLSVSAGGAAFDGQDEDYISLCRSADAALYDVKQSGKGTFKLRGYSNGREPDKRNDHS